MIWLICHYDELDDLEYVESVLSQRHAIAWLNCYKSLGKNVSLKCVPLADCEDVNLAANFFADID